MWSRTAAVALLVAATVLGAAPLAYAGEDAGGTDEIVPVPTNSDDDTGGLLNLGDLALLNNLNVCPDLNLLVPIGDVLGILSPGTATATSADAPITCTITSTGRKVGDN